MNVRHSRLARLVALTVVVSMPLLGMAGVASAKATKAAPKVCAKHPNKAKCKNSGGGGTTGGGTGGPPVQITVWETRPGGAPTIEVGVQRSDAGS